MKKVSELQPGDRVVRVIGAGHPGAVSMFGVVRHVTATRVYVAMTGEVIGFVPATEWPLDELWQFDRETGAEEDADLEWGVAFAKTGSVIRPVK